MSTTLDFDELAADLERRFRLRESELALGDRTLTLTHPADAEALISEEDFERDERLPYWADIWPSALVLAAQVVSMNGNGARALELGCGVGLVAVAASLAGFDVTATDYYEEALEFAALNVWRNAGASLTTRHVDWRAMPHDLGRFPLILGSDVLYEGPYAELVAAALDRTLAPGGRALIADPGRVAASAFIEQCRARDLHVSTAARETIPIGTVTQTITVYEVASPGTLR